MLLVANIQLFVYSLQAGLPPFRGIQHLAQLRTDDRFTHRQPPLLIHSYALPLVTARMGVVLKFLIFQ
jgi:hypothetical protein